MVSKTGQKDIDRVLIVINGQRWSIRRGNMTRWDKYRHCATIDKDAHGTDLRKEIARICADILSSKGMMSEHSRIRQEILQHFE